MTVIFSAAIAVLVLSASIAVPLLFRPFYYFHIEYLNLPEHISLTTAQIMQAFNEVMDYCLGFSDEFSAGVFPFSESGASHFADVRVLFRLDLFCLLGSLGVVVLLNLFCKLKKIKARLFLGHHSYFWSSVLLGLVFLLVGILAAQDFNTAFTVFHKLLFPGKDNWIFSYTTDPVIYILPEFFFRNSAILILVLLCSCCAVLIFADILANHFRKTKQKAFR